MVKLVTTTIIDDDTTLGDMIGTAGNPAIDALFDKILDRQDSPQNDRFDFRPNRRRPPVTRFDANGLPTNQR